MKKFLLSSLALCLMAFALNAQGGKRTDYASVWKEIESLLNEQRLPKSALEKINSLYSTAVTEKQYGHAVKAAIYRSNTLKTLEEDGDVAAIQSLVSDAEKLPEPAKSVLYSIIGDSYFSYYQYNRWQIYNRTETVEKTDDFRTWNAAQLVDEALKHYALSLKKADVLQQTPAEEYEPVLVSSTKENIKFLPTLYDLLGYRVLAIYSHSDISVTRPQQAFVIVNPQYMAAAETFATLPVESTDSLSLQYQSVLIYQQLLKFRLDEQKAGKPDAVKALVDVDLRRLEYVRRNGRFVNADELYEQHLKRLMQTYPSGAEYGYIAYRLAYLYKAQGDKWRSEGNPDFRNRLIEAVQLCETIENGSTASYYASSLLSDIKRQELSLTCEQQQLSNSPILCLIDYRNLDKVYILAYSLSEKEVRNFNDDRYNLSWMKKKSPAAFSEVTTVSQPDYQKYSAEAVFNGLPQGTYLLVAATTPKPDFSESYYNSSYSNPYALMQVSDISLVARDKGDGTSVQLYVADSRTGKPLENAKIEVYYKQWNRNDYRYSVLNTLHTDVNGMAEDSEWRRQGSWYFDYFKVTYNGRELKLSPSIYNRYWNESEYSRAVFFTDRAIYRPGQTVYFKGLMYAGDNDGSNRLLTKEVVTVTFRDANNQEVSRQVLTTNEFGSIQGNFSIPQGLLNGRMTLSADGRGATTIRVEEYKRPTFSVTFDPIKTNVALNKDVEVTGEAKALAGYAVDNAKVQYRVYRTISYRTYFWWYRPIYNAQQREVASGQVETDSKGRFTISFNAVTDDVRNDNLLYEYRVTADITDVNGETRSASLAVKAGKNPMLVQLQLPERISAGSTLQFPLTTTNLNGDFTPADIAVTVTELKSPSRLLRARLWQQPDTLILSRAEFEENFPLDPYFDEYNPSSYERGRQVLSLSINTKDTKELNLSSMKSSKSGWYYVELNAAGEDGTKVKTGYYIQLKSAKPEPIIRMGDWIDFARSEGEPGTNAEFMVAGGSSTSYVLYEVLLKNKIVEQKLLIVGRTPQLVKIPIKEEYRGGFAVQLVMVQDGRVYKQLQEISVPYSNKQLDIAFTTFRDKLQPGEHEKWAITVSSKDNEKEMAELVATLYDASLDTFTPHGWADSNTFYPRRNHSQYFSWQVSGMGSLLRSSIYPRSSGYASWYENSRPGIMGVNSYYNNVYYDDMELEESIVIAYGTKTKSNFTGSVSRSQSAPVAKAEMVVSEDMLADEQFVPQEQVSGGGEVLESNEELEAVTTRQNFNETAFFYPELRTDENGEIFIDFTIPEALTRWKMLGFAHTKDFKVGSITNELVTQKQVAISANVPRFFREGDTIVFTAKVNNLTEESLNGKAMLRFYDATNMEPIDAQLLKTKQVVEFSVDVEGSAGVSWTLVIPQGLQAVGYKLTAQAGDHTDGEEKVAPVLTNRMLVTETLPFSVRAGETKNVTFDRMQSLQSPTLSSYRYTLEFTSNPAWYAIQALPYLMEYPHECAEQTFSRFYANSLASAVANSTPRVKQIFDQWASQPDSQALLSNLAKNEELKQVVLAETPWVMQANTEEETKKRLGLLFDLNRMGNEMGRAFQKLEKMQYSNGGIPWFEGMEPSRYITQHIVGGVAHLSKLNAIDSKHNVNRMVTRGLGYLDGQILKDYNELRRIKNVKLEDMHIGAIQVHYLYTCSYSKHKPSTGKQLEAFSYYMGQAEKYWGRTSLSQQAMLAMVFSRYGNQKEAMKIIASLKERAQYSEEMGMYWKENTLGYYWYQAPIENQAVLIEAFNEVANDSKAVEEMKIWLLRNKQTTDWKTTKATAEATYALLMTGSKLLDNNDILDVKVGGKDLQTVAVEPIRPEAGTGYVKTSWSGSDIKPDMAQLEVKNTNSSGIAWGGLYWQYFEQLDKITHAETNLRMNKQLFLKKNTDRGPMLTLIDDTNKLQVGDVVKVRMELRADRAFEYVHLKDMRASGFEPISTLSGYRYQGGLGYYENVKDASINFFITYLPKGTYVFEYELRVAHSGSFSNGITTFQCMYAPEFSAHSEGIRVTVE